MIAEFERWLNEQRENTCGAEFSVIKKVMDKWEECVTCDVENNELVCIHTDEEIIYLERNEKYGNSFHDTWQKFGPVSGLTRMSDKFNRVCQLIMSGSNGNSIESIEDTLMDLSNYANMCIMEIRNDKEKSKGKCGL